MSDFNSMLRSRIGPEPLLMLKQAEEIGARPIRFGRGGSEHEMGALARITYGESGSHHQIVLSEEAEAHPFLDHTVAHECGHALRTLSESRDRIWVPGWGPKELERAARRLVPELRRHPATASLDHEETKKEVVFYHGETLEVLYNYPLDMRVEAHLFETQPDLRSQQKAALHQTLEGFVGRTKHPIGFCETISSCVFAAFGYFIARHILRSVDKAKPLLRADRTGLAVELAESVWQIRHGGYDADRRDVNRWARRLGVEGWYEWEEMSLVGDETERAQKESSAA